MFFSCSVGHSGSKFFLVGHSSFLLVVPVRIIDTSENKAVVSMAGFMFRLPGTSTCIPPRKRYQVFYIARMMQFFSYTKHCSVVVMIGWSILQHVV